MLDYAGSAATNLVVVVQLYEVETLSASSKILIDKRAVDIKEIGVVASGHEAVADAG